MNGRLLVAEHNYNKFDMLRRCLNTQSQPYNYKDAVAALNTLQSNASVVAQIRKHGRGDANLLSIPETLEWLRKAGYSPKDFDGLNCIHISGTKGKGSTSAFVSSILQRYGKSNKNAPQTIGLFTSPHLRFVRERIQLQNEPISEPLFASNFFEIWNKLSSVGDGSKPMYFRYLTIMALHVFLKEKVDSAVIECGIGGEYDSTNIIHAPKVTAVTALGIDHEALLGSTISEIAWHKAGIFKPGAIALTVPQPEEAMKVLRDRATEKNVDLHVIANHPQIESGEVKLGLLAAYQRSNASLAVAIASAQLRGLGCLDVPDLVRDPGADLPEEFKDGLRSVRWPGRSDVRKDRESDTTWYLDGAHTMESIHLSSIWFAEEMSKSAGSGKRVLVFNQQTRDAVGLLKELCKTFHDSLGENVFHKVIFTTNTTSRATGFKPDLISLNNNAEDVKSLKVQHDLADVWRELDPSSEVVVSPTIQDAIESARQGANEDGNGNHVLIIGSLHLVGGAIDVLESS